LLISGFSYQVTYATAANGASSAISAGGRPVAAVLRSAASFPSDPLTKKECLSWLNAIKTTIVRRKMPTPKPAAILPPATPGQAVEKEAARYRLCFRQCRPDVR
jgi:hypothetical protein